MAKGKFPNLGGQNMMQMQKQMKKIQKQMEDMQADLDKQEIEASAGGGMVKAVVNGKQELLKIKIDPDVVDPEDVDMLEDLVLAAVKSAMEKAQSQAEGAMSKITGGFNF
ncbi:MAG: YbaB/EbfC family nucleoid-associated protein [Tissierellia bacterium]|nr:YbaB/EbfC family nucleoid-associated protein [Tissierellia bacterium]